MTGVKTHILSAGLSLIFAVVANSFDFQLWNLSTFGYPKDLACQRYTNRSQRSPLECAIKCLRSECVAWTTSEITCFVCGRCIGNGDTLPPNTIGVYRNLQMKMPGKIIGKVVSIVRHETLDLQCSQMHWLETWQTRGHINDCFRIVCLTHWGRDKMADIFQTFSNAFSWMKMYTFWLKFHRSLFL